MVEVTSYAPGTPSWADLVTSDPEGARAFYGALLGWEFTIGGEEFGFYTTCTVRGLQVAGIAEQQEPGGPTAWTTYFATADADGSARRIAEHGGKLLMEPMDIPTQGSMLLAADPTGAVFGAWHGVEHPGAQLLGEPGAMVWNELYTGDLDAATAFYTGVFGYEWQDVDTGEGGPPYKMSEVDGKVACGAMQLPDASIPAQWRLYFEVADTDAAVASVERLGGSVIEAPVDSGYGRWADVADPQGGRFSLIRSATPGG
jgi:predicted enzyme related to lactoylglutathione lyase